MSKEKQIKEMAADLYLIDFCKHLEQKECDATTCNRCTAEALYNAGYRKQSEGEWITDEAGFVTCSECGEEHTWDEFRPPYCDMCGAKMKGGAE